MDWSKCCIVNVATPGRDNYLKAQQRLKDSLEQWKFEGTFLAWTGEYPPGSPTHQDVPYGFKVYAFREALRQGFRYILWLDASIWAVGDVTPVFDHIERKGWVMEYAGHTISQWINDNALDYFGLTREESQVMLMYGNGGFLGLNFDFPKCREFLDQWERACKAGAFNGSWSDHRHDMTCGSVVACRLGMTYHPAGKYLVFGAVKKRPDVVFCCQGMS